MTVSSSFARYRVLNFMGFLSFNAVVDISYDDHFDALGIDFRFSSKGYVGAQTKDYIRQFNTIINDAY